MSRIFPMDNTEYTAADLGAWSSTRTRGVFCADTHFAVRADGSMQVAVQPGLAWMRMNEWWGVCFWESGVQRISIPQTGKGMAAVTLRLDKLNRKSDIYIKTTSGSVMPQPIRDDRYDELIVAYIALREGQTSVTQLDVTDTRLDENLCGIMRDGVTGIPTQELYDTWLAWFDNHKAVAEATLQEQEQITDALRQRYAEKVETYSKLTETEYENYVTRMANYEATAKGDFDSWFNSIKEILDEEAAGNLQHSIEKLEGLQPDTELATITIEWDEALPYPACYLYHSGWGYGMGGAGEGPAGGIAMTSLPIQCSYDEGNITIFAPKKYATFTKIQEMGDGYFSLTKADETLAESLVLRVEQKIGIVDDSKKLGGQPATYYSPASHTHTAGQIGAATASHSQPASTITAGRLAGNITSPLADVSEGVRTISTQNASGTYIGTYRLVTRRK